MDFKFFKCEFGGQAFFQTSIAGSPKNQTNAILELISNKKKTEQAVQSQGCANTKMPGNSIMNQH